MSESVIFTMLICFQELLCESECPKVLKDLLLNQSESLKIAVTQAISNVSVIEKSHRYFQVGVFSLNTNSTFESVKKIYHILFHEVIHRVCISPKSTSPSKHKKKISKLSCGPKLSLCGPNCPKLSHYRNIYL